MSRSIPVCGCLVALVFASSAFAQAGAALTADEIKALLPGKVLTYRSDKRPVGEPTRPTAWVPRTDGSHSIVQFNLRPDQSVSIRCTFFARDGSSHACAGIAANDVGVWSVESDMLCLQWLTWNSSVKRCYRLRREGDRFRAEQISGGASSMDGTLVSIK
jgi:hypothetical protein